MLTNKTIHPVDRLVGARVRTCRRALRVSQTDLGKAVGLTFQQIQKYETGANRISASKLHDISVALKVLIDYFFANSEGLPQLNNIHLDAPNSDRLSRKAEGSEMLSAFSTIENAEFRASILALAKSLSRAA